MTTIGTKLAAVALVLGTVGSAHAGKGGSAQLIQQAIASGSQDAIIAEVERTEGLMCAECIDTVTALTEDNRYPVREVAAWWFAKRPQLLELMRQQMNDDLANGDATHVRNAADFIGSARQLKSLPALRKAYARGLTAEARFAIVRAVGLLAHTSGNSVLQAAMADSDAGVRAEAVVRWRDVLGQTTVTPLEPLLADSDARVRAEAETVIGAYKDANALSALEQMVVSDADPTARRNAAWALGHIGSADARQALATATQDKSVLVRGVAQAALASLK